MKHVNLCLKLFMIIMCQIEMFKVFFPVFLPNDWSVYAFKQGTDTLSFICLVGF